jgi:hypothetical protein
MEVDDARDAYRLGLQEFVSSANLSIDIASQRAESIEAFTAALSSLEATAERFHRALDAYMEYINQGGRAYGFAQTARRGGDIGTEKRNPRRKGDGK